jgi:AraC family transcriptional regulator
MTIEGELNVAIATAQLARFDLTGPSENLFYRDDEFWLDLCLTPRAPNARARYCDRWGPHRYEKLGGIMFLPAGHSLMVKSDGGVSQASIICQLHAAKIGDWFDGQLTWTDRRLEASLNIANPHIRSLMLRLGEEIRHPGFASEILTEMISGQMMIELCRHCSAIGENPASGGLASWRLRLIDERLAELCAPPTLSELSALCSVSVRQLTRGFRASRGYSIGDYVLQSRIANAKRLLATNDSIKAIAYAMGFASPSGFSQAFRRATGETPRQCRAASRRA